MPIQQNLPHAPATVRNRIPIRSVLDPYLKKARCVLEIASGTGEHIAWLAPQYPNIKWHPSDICPDTLPTINAYNQNNDNVLPALELNTQSSKWPISERFDLITCINMTHISDFKSTLCLFKNSVQYIEPTGVLYFYGPFNKANQFTSPGNEAFHMSLKQQNPQWGLRDVETIIHSAEESGWALIQHIDMPANNMSLFFQLNP